MVTIKKVEGEGNWMESSEEGKLSGGGWEVDCGGWKVSVE